MPGGPERVARPPECAVECPAPPRHADIRPPLKCVHGRSLHEAHAASDVVVTCATGTGARPAPRGAGKRESRAAPTHGRWSPVPAYTPERPTATWMSHALARVYVGGVRAAPGAAAPGRQSTLRIVTASGTSGGTRARETGADGNAPGATSGTRCACYGRRRAGAYEGMQRREGGRLVDEGAPRKRCEGCATPTPARGAPGEDAALSEALAMLLMASRRNNDPPTHASAGRRCVGPVKLQCACHTQRLL
ncbi:hypothetical protein DFH09DRAFT_1097109 [Mycena vulgaris]|nr:hypothetical protein DFH09DRAFT_1097109 [Mycena vulgaris]